MTTDFRNILKILFLIYIGVCAQLAQADEQEGPPPVPVITGSPVLKPISISIYATGNLKAINSIEITPEVSGRIAQKNFKDGGRIDAKQLLFKLEDALMQADLKQAQTRQRNSKAKLDRSLTLLEKSTGSVSDKEDAMAQFNIDEASVALAKARLAQTALQAPFSGVIGLSTVDTGDYVHAGQALVNLEKIEQLKVDFHVPEVYVSQLKVGQTIKLFIDAFEDKHFTGVVTAMDPMIDMRGHNVHLRAKVNNPDEILKPGLFTRIQLILQQKDSALVLAEQAILLSTDGPYVYKAVEGKANKQMITTGIRQNGEVEILSGLTPDDVVIIDGVMRVFEGATVYVPEKYQTKNGQE